MRCLEYTALISRYIDDTLGESERSRLLEHLAGCPRCAATLAQYRTMELTLRRASGVPSPVDGQKRVLDALAAPSLPRPLYLASVLGVVACLLAAIIVVGVANHPGWFLGIPGKPGPGPALAPAISSIANTVDDIGPRIGIVGEPVSIGPRPGRLYETSVASPARLAGLPAIVSYEQEVTKYTLLGAMRPYSDRASGGGVLPPEALIQRVTLERGPGRSQDYWLEIYFVMPNDTQYRLQDTSSGGPPRPWPRLLDEGGIVIGGQPWRYGRLPVLNQHGEPVKILVTTTGNRTIQLETTAPLPELLDQLDWLR